MKKIIVLLVFLFSSPAWGQVYPTIKIEQVNINPAYYVGLIVRFNNVEIQPNPGLFDAPKYLDSYVNKLLPQNSVGFGQLRLPGEQTNHLIRQGWQVYKHSKPRKYTISVCL